MLAAYLHLPYAFLKKRCKIRYFDALMIIFAWAVPFFAEAEL